MLKSHQDLLPIVNPKQTVDKFANMVRAKIDFLKSSPLGFWIAAGGSGADVSLEINTPDEQIPRE